MKPLENINLTGDDCPQCLTETSTPVCNFTVPILQFRPITLADMPQIMPFLALEQSRTTDYSFLGLLMWADRFDYQFAIAENTLFIKGRLENDRRCVAFSLPLGEMCPDRWMATLRHYCRQHRLPLRFSAIPEAHLELFSKYLPNRIDELPQWADYLYDAQSLATLSGKKYNKKRNHVNKFKALYDGKFEFRPIYEADMPALLQFMDAVSLTADQSESASAERALSRTIIEMYGYLGNNVEGALLKVDDKICAFTIADIKNDTLYIHIEKAGHEIEGSTETINAMFAAAMMDKYQQIKYINREDDGGNPGLRQAKQSYHPVSLLKKYNITFQG